MTSSTDSHDPHVHTQAHAHAPAGGNGGDPFTIDQGILLDVPPDAPSRSEQVAVFRLTRVLGWVIELAGIAVGVWLAIRAKEDPSFLRILSAAMVALAGVLWGMAARSVSRSGVKVYESTTTTA